MRPVPPDALIAAQAEVYDCWNRIGVRGDKSCPELELHVHCRNCPAYGAAAATLLNRDQVGPPAATAMSQFGAPAAAEDGATESAVIFRVGNEWFALSTLLLDEIVGARAIHSLPHRRDPALLGLVNIRGELVVCVSIAQLLIGEAAPLPDCRLIVLRHATTGRLAFPVDEVQHAHRYGQDDVRPVPATVARSASTLARGLLSWRDKMVACLDEKLILDALNRSLA